MAGDKEYPTNATVNDRMTAIADAIRDKTGGTEALTLVDMASGVNEVYEAGKKAEQREFWEVFQREGNRTTWQYAFAYTNCWTDKTYNPIYPIAISGTNDNMYYQAQITNTKVPIIVNHTTLRWTFRGSTIETMDITFSEKTTTYTDVFTAAYGLKNINAKGTIAGMVSFSSCPLSVESLKSIISCLKDYSGTGNEYAYTVTFKTSAFNALEAEGTTAKYNGTSCTWVELIDNKKWNLTLA